MRPAKTRTQFASRVLAVLVWALVATFAADARANPKVDAEALFDEGMRLIQAGKHKEACPKLAESLKLDPALGTQFRLAECYESIGKTASAWSLFRETAARATASKLGVQANKAQARADTLEPKLAKFSIVVPPEVAKTPGLSITRDGEVVGNASWNVSLPVDLGKHVIRVEAPGKRPYSTEVEAEAAVAKSVEIAALGDVETPTNRPPVLAIATLGVGASLLVAGGVFGGMALKQDGIWKTEFDAHCDSVTRDCDQASIASIRKIESDRDTYATLSTVGIIAGTALAAAGVVFWIAPWQKKGADVSMIFVGPSGPGVTLRGSF